MATTAVSVEETCRAAKRAARELQTLSSAVKDAALNAIADALIESTDEILGPTRGTSKRASPVGSRRH